VFVATQRGDADVRGLPGPVDLVVDATVVASGLEMPEGPIALEDGSVLVVEVARGNLTRVDQRGELTVVAECGGGPNGAALGPDGKVYVCNNGGLEDRTAPGCIQRVDLGTGDVETVFDSWGDVPLHSPNDLVFDDDGNFWFTDWGALTDETYVRGAIYFATADGSFLHAASRPVDSPNGIAISPDGSTLYWAETFTGLLRGRRIVGEGVIEKSEPYDASGVICGPPGMQQFDSMALDPEGRLCVATLVSGRITVAAPDGSWCTQLGFPDELVDPITTNICFGGPEGRTAFVTQGSAGRLISFPWPKFE
jgi:gluconolactonase